MNDSVKIIVAEHNNQGKIVFKEFERIPKDELVRITHGEGEEILHIPGKLYLNGVREFLFTRGCSEPIDFSTGQHGQMDTKLLAQIMDNSIVESLVNSLDPYKEDKPKNKRIGGIFGTRKEKTEA